MQCSRFGEPHAHSAGGIALDIRKTTMMNSHHKGPYADAGSGCRSSVSAVPYTDDAKKFSSNEIAPGSRILIIGGTSGIGLSVVERCSCYGARTVVIGRSAGSKELPQGAEGITLDMCEEDASHQLRRIVGKELGGLDILIYCASSFSRSRIDHMSDEQWDEMWNLNVTRFFQVVRDLSETMQSSRYPRIVAISSITGPITGLPAMSHYGAAKCAIEGFVRTAALEFAETNSGITINVVRPGLILTESLKQSYGPERIDAMNRLIPRRRLGTPEEVASAVCYLASPAASFISGASLVVDGAQTLIENPYAP